MYPLKLQHNDVVLQRHGEMGSREGKERRRVVQRRDRVKGETNRNPFAAAVFHILSNISSS